MVQAKPALPSGHGELLVRPAFAEWADLAVANRSAASGWTFALAGRRYAELRASARREAIGVAEAYCERLDIEARPGNPEGLVVASGHQPELYHTGVWAKAFLLQRLADETGASGLDLVVDTDGFERLGVTVPCFGGPEVERCHADLAQGRADTCFACTPTPKADAIAEFVTSVSTMLQSLPAASVRRHFEEFGEALLEAAPVARNVGELVTAARRRYERPSHTDYLELPVSALSETSAFRAFAGGLALDAARFAEAYNHELAAYREAKGIRTAAQPVPDLAVSDSSVELPFWALHEGRRSSVTAKLVGDGVVLTGGDVRVSLPADGDPVEVLGGSGLCLAPKALTLTMFARMFLCDLFVHGVGGGGYDQVTDGIVRRYFGVEPPRFVVASLTMFLPLGAHVVSEDEVREASERLNRFEHNPDALICDAEFDSRSEQEGALELAREKARLVEQMKQPDADKKALGQRIREANAALRELLAPVGEALAAEKRSLEAQRSASDILTDRTYPFCFWAPQDVADKVR